MFGLEVLFDCVVLHNIKSQYVDLTVAYFKMDGTSTNNSILYRKEQEKLPEEFIWS